MEKQCEFIEREIERIIKASPILASKADIVKSIPGVGKVTAYTLLAEMPELGSVSNKQIAALAGVAPFIKQSGKDKGRATISGGRQALRSVLYMAAMVAVQWNSAFKVFYKRLKESGKKPKLALVAVMRKLIVILNIMVRKGQHWRYA